MKEIVLLGLSGSIGDSAVKIIAEHSDLFHIQIASVHSQTEKAIDLAIQMHIPHLVITGKTKSDVSTELYPQISFHFGQEALLSLLKDAEYDICINAVSGSAGLPYTMAVLNSGRDLALANKESLVMAGHLVNPLLHRNNVKILPVDSEHSAIFQVLFGHEKDEIRHLHITASGGPFRQLPLNEFKDITFEQALKHPTWDMGIKVTIDSATMMNKGLEVIEAHWLFEMPYENIKACIHPQSVIHSMVEFKDGSILAQMSKPSMQLPILYALSYPKHIHSENVKTDLYSLSALTFEEIQPERYPLFFIACQAGKTGGLYPTIMNAANERALMLLQKGALRFCDIHRFVDDELQKRENVSHPDLTEILEMNDRVLKGV